MYRTRTRYNTRYNATSSTCDTHNTPGLAAGTTTGDQHQDQAGIAQAGIALAQLRGHRVRQRRHVHVHVAVDRAHVDRQQRAHRVAVGQLDVDPNSLIRMSSRDPRKECTTVAEI